MSQLGATSLPDKSADGYTLDPSVPDAGTTEIKIVERDEVMRALRVLPKAAVATLATAAAVFAFTVPAQAAVTPNTVAVCSLNVEIVHTTSVYGKVSCSSSVQQIFMSSFGEDGSGDTTWSGTPKNCYGTNSCSGVWMGDSADVSRTVCYEAFNGNVAGNCKTARV